MSDPSAGSDAIKALKKATTYCDDLVTEVKKQTDKLNSEPWPTLLWIGLRSPFAGEIQQVWKNIGTGFQDIVQLANQVKTNVNNKLLQPALRAGEQWLDGPANVEKARTGDFSNGGWEPMYSDLQAAANAFNHAATDMTWTGQAANNFNSAATYLFNYLNGGSGSSPVPQLQAMSTQLGTVATRLGTMQERLETDCEKLIVDWLNGAIQTLNTGIQGINVPQDVATAVLPGGEILDVLQEVSGVVAQASNQAKTAFDDFIPLLDDMNDQAQAVMNALQSMQPPEPNSIPQDT